MSFKLATTLSMLGAAALISACATDGLEGSGSSDRGSSGARDPMRGSQSPAARAGSGSASGSPMSGGAGDSSGARRAGDARPAARDDDAADGGQDGAAQGGQGGDAVTRPTGKAEWVPVFETDRGASYSDQRVVFVDRANVQPQKLDNLTYYLARSREVRSNRSSSAIQEIAVLCEGHSKAPAIALRGEGREDGKGNVSIRPAPTPLSIDQFTTQRVRLDPNNSQGFVVRAVCKLATEKGR